MKNSISESGDSVAMELQDNNKDDKIIISVNQFKSELNNPNRRDENRDKKQ